MTDGSLDNILQVAPDATRSAAKTVIEQTAHLMLEAELVEAEALVAAPPVAAPAPVGDPHSDDMNEDVDFAREQIKQLIDDGRSAMNGAMELATAGDQPRAYEVVATLLTAVVQANKELINIHKTRKDALKADKEAKQAELHGAAVPGNVNIEKAVFIGRASDLLRELQKVKKQTEAALQVSDTRASES